MPSLPPIRPEDEAVAERIRPHGSFDAPAVGEPDSARFDYLLRLGDDALILGQRLAEWCGRAPSVEVDLSLANIALDLVGQATLLLDEAGKIEGVGRDGDRLAFHRDVLDYRNCLLVEQPNGDFARTMARQLIFSAWQYVLFERLTRSTDDLVAAVAAKAIKEVSYHRELAAEWVIRLGDGTDESHARTQDGLEWLWRFVPELFDADDTDRAMAARGIGADMSDARPKWESFVLPVLSEATLAVPKEQRPILGGRRGHHSEQLGHLLAVMQHIPRSYPDANW